MNYELIQLKAKTVAGIKGRTSNTDSQMGAIISGLWQQYFEKGFYQAIPNKIDDKSLGLYTHYEHKDEGKYDIVVCCAVEDGTAVDAPLETLQIPSGLYARFVVKGHMINACIDFWTQLPSFGLNRSYTYDFEEYQGGGDMDNAEIHMYIAVNSEGAKG